MAHVRARLRVQSQALGARRRDEAARALVSACFVVGADRVVARCNPQNELSWRLLERLGFRREGHLLRKASFTSDDAGTPIWHGAFLYATLAEEWSPPSEPVRPVDGQRGPCLSLDLLRRRPDCDHPPQPQAPNSLPSLTRLTELSAALRTLLSVVRLSLPPSRTPAAFASAVGVFTAHVTLADEVSGGQSQQRRHVRRG